jgi:hypothetical protein
MLKRLARDKHSILLGSFLSCEENEVSWIRHQALHILHKDVNVLEAKKHTSLLYNKPVFIRSHDRLPLYIDGNAPTA